MVENSHRISNEVLNNELGIHRISLFILTKYRIGPSSGKKSTNFQNKFSVISIIEEYSEKLSIISK